MASLAPLGQFTFSPSPTGFTNAFLFRVGEALGPPAGGCASQEVPLIRLAFGQPPSPYKGEGLAGDRKGRPYGGNALVALVR